jgi:hypothetical protein
MVYDWEGIRTRRRRWLKATGLLTAMVAITAVILFGKPAHAGQRSKHQLLLPRVSLNIRIEGRGSLH